MIGEPLGSTIYDAVQAVCKSDQQTKCEKALNKIRDIEGKLTSKRRQMNLDKGELFLNYYSIGSNPGKGGTFQGHIDQIDALYRGLQNAIQEAKDLGCL